MTPPVSPSSARERKSRSACRRAEPQDRRGVAVVGVGLGERLVQRLDRRRDRVGVGALVEQEARDRAARWAAPAPRGGTPGSRRPPAAARAPGRRAGGGRRRSRAARGSATRSIRSTMSAASIRAPASRNAYASSRSIVRPVTPQNSAAALLDVARRPSTGRCAAPAELSRRSSPRWNVLIASHISAEKTSRTVRAPSRAASTQLATDAAFVRSSVSALDDLVARGAAARGARRP